MLSAFIQNVAAHPIGDAIHIMRGVPIFLRLGLPVYRNEFILDGSDADLFLALSNESLSGAFVALNISADKIPNVRPNGLGRRTKAEKHCASGVEEHRSSALSDLNSHSCCTRS